MEWIEQDTGGGVVCLGTDLGRARCLILNGDSAGVYEVTAEQWFNGEGDSTNATTFAQIEDAVQLRSFLDRLVAEPARSEIVVKWEKRFGVI